MDMEIIRIDGLQKKYANGDGVEQVSLSIRQGEVVALLGANGAGKTTTLRCITGMYKPNRGSVTVGGHRPGTPEAQRLIAFVPDQPYLYPTLTVAEHVQFRARAFKVEKKLLKEKVIAALSEVNLVDLQDRLSGQLSRGQKQRVLLAAAEVQDAALYMLDEPTVGLDIPSKQWLVQWLLSKAASKKAALVSTHSLEFVLEVAHRALLIRDGEIIRDTAVPREEKDWPAWRQEIIGLFGKWSDE